MIKLVLILIITWIAISQLLWIIIWGYLKKKELDEYQKPIKHSFRSNKRIK